MNKNKRQSLNQAHRNYLDIALYDHPLETLKDFVTKDVMGYGTALDEKAMSIKDFLDIVIRQRKQAEGIDIQIEEKPILRKILNKEAAAIFVDEITLTMNVAGEVHQLPLRLSSILSYVEGQWKVVHWHGSIPKNTDGSDDAWHVGEWRRQKEELERQVAEKTAELQKKNQDLLVEAALERVRSRTMAMQHSKELREVVAVLYQQFEHLQIADLGCNIMILDEKATTIENWFSDITQSEYPESYFMRGKTHSVVKKVWKAWHKNEPRLNIHLKGKKIESYSSYLFEKTDYIRLPDPVKKAIAEVKQVYFTYVRLQQGFIQAVNNSAAFSEADVAILNRFAKVFDQAYTRFLDLKKADTQAFEAKIETALERVRAKTMAMQKSKELSESASVMFHQVERLGIKLLGCGFTVVDDGHKSGSMYFSIGGTISPQALPLDISKNREIKAAYEAWKNKKTILVNTIKGVAVKKHYENIQKQRRALHISEELNINEIYDRPVRPLPAQISFHVAFFSRGWLVFNTVEPIANQDLLLRFAKVFEQTYTRFLDLQKAEAQAREAQIEAALERVRASAMAMHTSEGLLAVTYVLREQMALLEEKDLESTLIHIYDEEKDNFQALYSYRHPEDPTGPIAHGKVILDWSHTARARKDKKKYYSDETDYTIIADRKMLEEWYHYLDQVVREVVEHDDQGKILIPDVLYYNYSKFTGGALLLITNREASDHSKYLLKRSAEVFNLAYTRFLDLQKAEAQAKEAQIEVALERVRARTMAMHKSSELAEAGSVLFEQLAKVGIEAESSWISLIDPEKDTMTIWTTHGKRMGAPKNVKASDHPNFKAEIEAWNSGKEYINIPMPKEAFIKAGKEIFDLNVKDKKEKSLFHVLNLRHHFGFLGLGAWEEAKEEELLVYSRFAKVFEQTYTRFLDLQKAEAQTREAQIEAALERVRARTMAMQSSDELADVIGVAYQQFNELQIADWGGNIMLFHPDEPSIEIWLSENDQQVFSNSFFIRGIKHPFIKAHWEAWNSDRQHTTLHLKGKQKESYDAYCLEQTDLKLLPPVVKNGILSLKEAYFHFSRMQYGFMVAISTVEQLSPEGFEVLDRFARVFEQTYTRFLDLQKAEAQAREAQIEAALERVRARTMAMHQSDELRSVIAVVFEQLQELGFAATGCSFVIYDKETGDNTIWISGFGSEIHPESYFAPYFDHPYLNAQLKAWKAGVEFKSFVWEGELKKSVDEYYFQQTDYKYMPDEIKGEIISLDRGVLSDAFMSHGFLEVNSDEPVSEDEKAIILRFAKVFDQTYTRFLDIQKAEAQAREAQIEAALERVRSRTMAMHKSEELPEAANLLFQQIQSLDMPAWSAGYCIWDEDKQGITLWMSSEGVLQPPFHAPLTEDPSFIHMREAYERGETFFVDEIGGVELVEHYEYMRTLPVVGEILDSIIEAGHPLPTFQIFHCAYFSHGFLLFITYEPVPEAHDIFKRFAKVFDQTYTRFLDLQRAEAQAREARKQASLDRVRGQIASMRSVDDLQQITPLIWNELTILGVPFIRCGVLIIDDDNALAQVYLSDPQGQSLAALELPIEVNQLTAQAANHWRQGDVYRNNWTKEDLLNWTQTLVEQGHIPDQSSYQGTLEMPESLEMHFVPFTQGMLYVGNVEPLSEASIELVKSLAETFAIAYARYEDFGKLAKAKEAVEDTLAELKATQSQLIQSEKMASLGELTAGIAHEIQNPLNFVNNFSGVSNELLEEVAEELEAGNTQEVKEILAMLAQNLEKINHHGGRASSIVKGMLQHSRAGKGEKQWTDINALCDEYLRLAYHGMRAKDKSFNVKMETNFDEDLMKINVIPQDIGRVMLNLITNAFHACAECSRSTSAEGSRSAVGERKKKEGDDFVPNVHVSTHKNGKKVEIKVTDNGNGIPQNIIDKIFQPFFTTKPTGQGTGLGLSLSYDIVKAHGGDLKVESTEGIGTELIISLPL